MAVKSLFEHDFVSHYGIKATVVADEYHVETRLFELEDKDKNPVVGYGEGKVRFSNVAGGMDVFAYERFINSTEHAFQDGLTRCDYVLTSSSPSYLVCLLELTSAKGSIAGLFATKQNLPHGKIAKVETQLCISLQKMLDVPSIAADFANRQHKICLTAYRIFKTQNPKDRFRHPNSRYREIETRETNEHGARVSAPDIERLGFLYYRIAHGDTFRIQDALNE